MIVRILNNNRVVMVRTGLLPEQEEAFMEANPTGGFMLVDSLPEQPTETGSNYKWDGTKIVIDDASNLADKVAMEVEAKKQYLNDTDFKMTTDYDKDVTDVAALRATAREYIRANVE
jgi:hypothetical protein